MNWKAIVFTLGKLNDSLSLTTEQFYRALLRSFEVHLLQNKYNKAAFRH